MTGFWLEPKIIVGRGKCAKLFVFCSALVPAHSPGLEGENYLFFSLCPVLARSSKVKLRLKICVTNTATDGRADFLYQLFKFFQKTLRFFAKFVWKYEIY